MGGNLKMLALLSLVVVLLLLSALKTWQMSRAPCSVMATGTWTSITCSANSSDFWRTYVLKADCDTEIQFQELYWFGKSVNVSISDMFNTSNVFNLTIQSTQPFNCSSNVQDPDVAAMDPRYHTVKFVCPQGVYAISMKLDNYTNVLGYRGYAVKASVPIDRLVVASKCRERHNPNM